MKQDPKQAVRRPETATLPSVFGYDTDTHTDYAERPGTLRGPVRATRLG